MLKKITKHGLDLLKIAVLGVLLETQDSGESAPRPSEIRARLGIPPYYEIVNDVLLLLKSDDYVHQTPEGSNRWEITERGKQFIDGKIG